MSALPSNPHPDEAGHARGAHIEARLHEELARARDRGVIATFFLPDAVVLTNAGEVYFIEAKAQDHFEAPPFNGQGLPVDQARRYEQVRLATRIRTLFVVYDGQQRMSCWLDQLEGGKHFDTAGTIKTRRRIYPLTNFPHRNDDAQAA